LTGRSAKLYPIFITSGAMKRDSRNSKSAFFNIKKNALQIKMPFTSLYYEEITCKFVLVSPTTIPYPSKIKLLKSRFS
jgi:hypothetical protein